MPILTRPLDPHGHAPIDLLLYPALPRRQALQGANQPLPPPLTVTGLIDTGATLTIIDPTVRQALHLLPFRVRRASLPNATTPVRVRSYKVDLGVYDSTGYFTLLYPMLSVVEMPLAHTGSSVLVGCDVLARCLFSYNGSNQTFTLAY